jgi:hypothetical protein
MPLNPQLYNALARAFPSGVKIAKEGEAMRYKVRKDFVTQKERVVIEDDGHGEEYRVCCPFCGDTRFRLWINHKWDTEEPVSKLKFGLHLANCFNDGCDLNREADRPDRREKQLTLRRMIDPMLSHTVTLPFRAAAEPEPIIPELPDKLIPLTQLDPSHPARQYIERRGFDIDLVVDMYQVAYCPDDPHPFVDNRIIIPVRQQSKLVGWQARYIGEAPKHLPKYFTMPGMRKMQVLYNYDHASQYPIGVIMEGVTDVWTIGGQGVNIFGSSVGEHQRRLIHSAWGQTGIVLLSDSDVGDTEEKWKQYTKMRDSLQSLCKWGMLEVRLPKGDPGDYSSRELWSYILARASDAKYQHPVFDAAAFERACHRS